MILTPERSSEVIFLEMSCLVLLVHTGYPGIKLLALKLHALIVSVPLPRSEADSPDPPPFRKGLLIARRASYISHVQKRNLKKQTSPGKRETI